MNTATADSAIALGPRIRRERHRKAMTLAELGAASGVSIGYLSQVERGNATPTLGTLSQIAAALSVDVDWFIRTPSPVEALTRAENRPRFSVADSEISYEQIGADFPGHELSSYVMHVPAGFRSEEVAHAGEELLFVLEGEIVQVLDGQPHVMRTGDSLHYMGETPHSWSNDTDRPARVLWVGRMQWDQSGKIDRMRPGRGSPLPHAGPARPRAQTMREANEPAVEPKT